MVACNDGTLYTGWAIDVEARVAVHNAGRGSVYCKQRRPVRLVYQEEVATRGLDTFLTQNPKVTKTQRPFSARLTPGIEFANRYGARQAGGTFASTFAAGMREPPREHEPYPKAPSGTLPSIMHSTLLIVAFFSVEPSPEIFV